MVSFAPLSVVKLIALVVASFDEIATCPPAIFTSLAVAALISTPPAEALISTAFVPVPAEFIVTVSAPPPLAANVIPELVELILTAPDVLMPTVEEFPAMLTPPAASSVKAPDVVVKLEAPAASNVIPAPVALISTVPDVVISTSAAFPAMLTPPAPSSVNALTDVNVIACALVLTAVDAALPTVIVLADAPVPTLIAPVFVLLPMLIVLVPLIPTVLPSTVNAPELISTIPVVLTVNVPPRVVLAPTDKSLLNVTSP